MNNPGVFSNLNNRPSSAFFLLDTEPPAVSIAHIDEEVERVMHEYDWRSRSKTRAQRRRDRQREARLAVRPHRRIQRYYIFSACRCLASCGRLTPHISRRFALMLIRGCGAALRFQGALDPTQ